MTTVAFSPCTHAGCPAEIRQTMPEHGNSEFIIQKSLVVEDGDDKAKSSVIAPETTDKSMTEMDASR